MREKRFALSLGLPEDSTGDCARVTLVGQSAALVEGLCLRELSVDAALIEGHVLTATYAGGGRTP